MAEAPKLTVLQQVYLELLEHEHEAIREEAVKQLIEIIDSDVVEVLAERIENPDFEGMLEAIWLLGKAEATQVTETLIERFQEENDPQVREVIAGAFAEMGDVRALQILIDALEDEHSNVRDAAAIALGELRDSRAIKPLIQRLKSPHYQAIAGWALAMIGDKRAIKPLTNTLLQAPDESVRGMAARALGKMSHPDADQAVIVGLEDSDDNVLIEVIRVVGERQLEQFLPELEALFEKQTSDRVRLAVAVAMSRCGKGQDFRDYLAEVLQEDPDWGARLSALIGLRQMPYEEVEADIRRALEDEHWLVQKIAARSLLELQDEMLYDALEELLGDEEEDIMQAVIESSFFELLENSDD